jgi:hypothetical protein
MKRVMFALAAAVSVSFQFGCCASHCDAPRCCKPLAGGVFGNWGCGGMYWGDWHSQPPDYCTHCDHYGNVTHASHDGGHYGGPDVPDGYEVIDDRVVSPQQPTPAPPPPVPARPAGRTRAHSPAY